MAVALAAVFDKMLADFRRQDQDLLMNPGGIALRWDNVQVLPVLFATLACHDSLVCSSLQVCRRVLIVKLSRCQS